MPQNPYRILAVDDNQKNLQVLGALLSSESYNVDFAVSGEDALKCLQQAEYDLVLLDIMMPVMDGYETCKAIRALHRQNDIPVIFLTARTDTGSITQGFASGGYDYITKPFRADELLARVNTHVELKRLREQQQMINEWLEDEVKARTEELNEANLHLKKANEDLTKLDRAKNDFLRLINHEIRTPLNAILGFTEVLKSELRTSEIYEYVDYLDAASLRLEKFLMVVLQITELRSKRSPLETSEINLGEITSLAVEKLHETLAQKGIRVAKDGSLYSCRVVGNPALILQAVCGLIENAIQYSDEGMTISINRRQEEGTITLEVTDEGCGFSDEMLKKLFQPFTIGERQVDKNPGLGLTLIKLIMEAHKGEVIACNLPGRGASVSLRFHSNLLE